MRRRTITAIALTLLAGMALAGVALTDLVWLAGMALDRLLRLLLAILVLAA
ncbi:hypothetical protein BACT_0480 [Bifidobacterium actinocoloniiforme DSM 22766]|uniref:Uncharacterized protein n=1 Tax=Bifidobacterium actinocoloniiforme DSM 22766 TaxID=1437605 RepID=A0A086YZT0_9BIFI|nr:hypothetical protein [Bifidobacterium actinocoloniiforme]KFI39780.1 hypothetical protein BACT_0480 [Bifidobacterium actinocoloniiforme DSM 22766]